MYSVQRIKVKRMNKKNIIMIDVILFDQKTHCYKKEYTLIYSD